MTIAEVVRGFARALPEAVVYVYDNNSTDDSAAIARQHGAVVVPAPVQGYGSACLAGLEYLRRNEPPEIVVFLDADYSDHPEELPRVIAPILAGEAQDLRQAVQVNVVARNKAFATTLAATEERNQLVGQLDQDTAGLAHGAPFCCVYR